MEAKEVSKTFTCDGKRKNGSPCKAELDTNMEFCRKCGKPISKPRVCVGKKKDGSPCGWVVEDDSDYCPKCGTEIPEEEKKTTEKEYCTGKKKDGAPCQAEIVPDQYFCSKCGKSYETAGADNKEPQVPKKEAAGKETTPETSGASNQHTGVDDSTESNKDHPVNPSDTTAGEPDGTPQETEDKKEDPESAKTTESGNSAEEQTNASPSRSPGDSAVKETTAKDHPEESPGSPGSGATHDAKPVKTPIQKADQADTGAETSQQPQPGAQKRTPYSEVTKRGLQETQQKREPEEKQPPQERLHSVGSVSGMVDVVFQVIISKAFDFKSDVHEALVMLGPSFDEYHSVLLNFVRDTTIGPLVCGRVPMLIEERNHGFEYKYSIRKRDPKNHAASYVWEHLESDYKGVIVNRALRVPEKDKRATGEYIAYDGIIHPKPSWSLVHNFVSYVRNTYEHEAKAAVDEFLPAHENISRFLLDPALDPKKTAESYLETIHRIVSTLPYPFTITKIHAQEEKLIIQGVEKKLVAPLLEVIENSENGTRLTSTLAFFLLKLCKDLCVDLKAKNNNLLCRAMRIAPDVHNKVVPEMEHLKVHFPVMMQDKKHVAQHLRQLIEKSGSPKSDCSWLHCVPLLHFLEDASQPFEEMTPNTNVNAQHGEWWGIESVLGRKQSFKRAWNDNPSGELKEIITAAAQLEPLFKTDALLSRTLVACLGYQPLLTVLLKCTIPLEVMGATLGHNIQQRGKKRQTKETEELLLNVIRKMSYMWKQERDRECTEQGLKLARCQVLIIKKQFKVILDKREYFQEDLTRCMIRVMFLALDRLACVEERICPDNRDNEWNQHAKDCAKEACTWNEWTCVSHVSPYAQHRREKLSKNLMSWVKLLEQTDDTKHDGLRGVLVATIAGQFEKCFEKSSPVDKLSMFLSRGKPIPAFTDILNRLTFASLEQAFRESENLFKAEINAELNSLLSDLLVMNWEKEKVQDRGVVLEFTVTWAPMVHYLNMSTNKHNKAGNMNEKAAECIAQAMTAVSSAQASLMGGNIQISTLKFLIKNEKQFCDVCEFSGTVRTKMAGLLNLRKYEMEAYEQNGEYIGKLFEFCREYLKTEDAPDVKKCIDNLRVESLQLRLSDVCEIAQPDTKRRLADYKPKANPWQLPDDVLDVLTEFENKISSKIFCKLLSAIAANKGTDLTSTSFWRAFLILWKDVMTEWESLCAKMIDGSMTLAETVDIFRMFSSKDSSYKFGELREELLKIAGKSYQGWVDDRIRQFKSFTEIKQHVEAADLMLQMKEAYQMEDGFEDIEKIYKLSQNEKVAIRDMGEGVRALCTQLEDLTPHNITCLKGFLEPRSQQFLTWIRTTMKGGLKELKVFVDLAFISAGEEPYAVDTVNCFHTTAIGYAPLIFMTAGDKGFLYLMEQIKIVFGNIENDPKLPKKLADISPKLEWFQDIQKSHGSVEKTAMTQVGNINARGVFKVGSVKNRGMDVGRVIQLDVIEDTKGQNPTRRYTYNELLDLQSRLMLVAGQADKGKEDVVRFITIMDSMVRLGKKYVQLSEDGCILFLDWSVNFLCDTSSPVCCTSEFSGHEMLKGHRSKQDLEDFIAGVASFLEKCHNEWLDYVDTKRKEYPEFNYYLIKQLVFLQQELVKVGRGNVSKYVYPLLSLIKSDCTPQDVEQAWEEAMDEVQKMKQQRRGQQEEIAQQEDEKKGMKDKITKFLKEMKDADIPKHKAVKALKAVGPEDPEEGLLWCMEHECDEEDPEYAEELTEEEEEEKKEVGQRITELLSTSQSIGESAVMWLKEEIDTGEDTLQAMIGSLSLVWKKFLESVASGFQDFLSMEHLGIILKCLARKDGRALKRTLPPVCKAGSPNLILCPKTEVLNAVTYMYMFPAESETPLPQPDEVLMCTDTTTFEEVDIFLRRAIFDNQHNKVHCLAFADSLPYDVGDMAEKRIKEYHSQTGNAYQLVVICTSENEYRSHIVAALQRYHRPTRDVIQSNQVCKYLMERFSGVIRRQDRDSASSLDPESLSVRVIRSNRSGVGKTLYKERLATMLKERYPRVKRKMSLSIPLHCRVADTTSIATLLLQHTLEPVDVLPRIIHLDISYQVLEGVDHLLFNLLVMGCVSDAEGRVWLRSPMDLYIVETMPLYDQQRDKTLVHQIFHILPSLKCWSPKDSLTILQDPSKIEAFQTHDRLFDDLEFGSEVYQRPFQYLMSLEEKKKPSPFQPDKPRGEKTECLTTLLKYCGIHNPSWSELTHFVSFLNKQLQDFEFSNYCNMAVDDDLPGFSTFVLRFIVQMSRDFATRSLNVSEQSLAALETLKDNDETNIEQYQMRRTWETSPHPYIFFNPDRHTMTFLGFSINKRTGDLMDQQTKSVLEERIIGRDLFAALEVNQVPLAENFDDIKREERLRRLYRVFGVDEEEMTEGRDGQKQIIDPDETYELTTDNVKKILAIYMRFRCNIPVIVMGETGCGKTRLVKFLCALQTPKQKEITTMVLVKVHGGTTASDIQKKVHQAEKKAQENAAKMKAESRPIYTVLFFDEANTTDAVGAIKEVMCDGTMNGQPITLNKNLKMVACCNPYRKHSDELIRRLENAGLGYHVDADKTIDKLGRVPMRWLVYRVQPLPQSMLPLVWDFGQLSPRMEELYIRQMVRRYVACKQLIALDERGLDVICRILIESQEFMRQQKDECSFVSLRDVERALTVTSWFYRLAIHKKVFYTLLEEELKECNQQLPSTIIALVLSLGVCYRACLGSVTEQKYDTHIVQFFRNPLPLPGGVAQFRFIISKCQDILLSNVRLEENIARNQALKENVFMMVVCIELRIPLFLVGKPGSSKSLAKTIVSDAMQGTSAHSDLFRQLKQAQMVSFQCSPLATAEGIQSMFRQCARYQKNKNMDTFVSVVVLDEVGLAEDSPKMALKTLHPLLEDGYTEDEKPEDHAKVAFVGISNWALDPAKMNRGLHVQRDVPNELELHETAKGICSTKDESTMYNVRPLIPKLAEAYLAIFKEAKQKREFFGLRDFYSLVKMVYGFASRSGKPPTHKELIASVRRNFGGLDIDPMNLFKDLIPAHINQEKALPTDPDCTPSGLITAALNENDTGGESRYLLLLTENYGGLSILTERLLAHHRVVPIFGSSFPRDQEYTKICTNINRVKVCMETGQTVILLNLENLYESLYDALNQYYAMLGGERYVDLGLGTHRVKCRVHRQFRLIVVAEKDTVYEKFPIPLINRLEKHFLTVNNIMTEQQLELARDLETWATDFVKTDRSVRNVRPDRQQEQEEDVAIGDVFMGFHVDTAPAIVLKVWDKLQAGQNPDILPKVLEESKRLLLWCATPDAVVRSRKVEWNRVYYEEQKHEHLAQYLQYQLREDEKPVIAQVTTHCRLLTDDDRVSLCRQLSVGSITLLTLQAFETEQQFNQQIRAFFAEESNKDKIMIIQSESGDINKNLVKCAQYCVQDQMPENSTSFHVVFIVQLPRIAGGCYTGFLGGSWHCLHIDELRTPDTPFPPATQLESQTPAALMQPPVNTPVKERPTKPKEREHDDTEEGELDVEGVEVEVHDDGAMEGDPEWEQPKGFSPEYVRELLTSCVQAAVSLVDKRGDEHDIDARATQRISLMLNLMRDNDEFAAGIHKMVWHILKKKEEHLANAAKWLTKEAARLDSVQKAGTFRRAWAQCLENKVIPILACIVAYLDSCANLDLLQHIQRPGDAEAVSCIERAWLNILQDVCNVNYDELRTTHNKDDIEEFTVPRPGAGNVPFVCKLPFPWIVWETVNTVICEAKHAESGGAALRTAGSYMVQRHLGQCLERAVGQSEEEKMHTLSCYISDMFHFAYKLSEDEHELFQQCVQKGLRQLDVNLAQLEVGRGLVSLHWVLDQMKPRLEFILDMNDRRPSSVVDLQENNGAGAQLLAVADEMTEDVAMLMLLLEDLQPDLERIKQKDGIRDWMGRFSKVSPVIMRVFNSTSYLTRPQPVGDGQTERDQPPDTAILPPDNTLPFGKESRTTLKLARIMWTRILAVRLFLDYMNPLRAGPEMTRNAMKSVSVALLWKLLESLHKDINVNQKQLHTFRSVDLFLKQANGHMIKGLLGEVNQCMFCEKNLTRGPIELPCKHRLCQACYMIWCPKNRPGQCPQCREEVPEDFDHTDCEYWDAVEQLHHYQRQTSGFLMALVSQLCFGGHETPEPEAVSHIINQYIMHESAGKTLIQTKHMTVQDDIVDPTPVLRTYLLRLLLKYEEKEVKELLQNNLLKKYQKIIDQVEEQENREPTSALVELSLLVIFCVEDLLHESEAAEFGELAHAENPSWLKHIVSVLHSLRPHLSGPAKQLTTLESIGQLRYVLDAVVRVIQTVFLKRTEKTVFGNELKELLQATKEICSHPGVAFSKKYLIKKLCREQGVQAYTDLDKIADDDDLLKWISLEEFTIKVEIASDMFLTVYEGYKILRDCLRKIQYSADSTELMQILQGLEMPGERLESLLLLSLHRATTEIQMQKLPEPQSNAMRGNLANFVQDCNVIKDKDLAHQLLRGTLWSPTSPLCQAHPPSTHVQNMQNVLLHVRLVLWDVGMQSRLLRPLHALAFNPREMTSALLPTMPQDDFAEVFNAVAEVEYNRGYGDAQAAIWRCVCGFRFIVGNCGRVVQSKPCPKCGRMIGGEEGKYNVPLQGTTRDAPGTDETKTGHIVGNARSRPLQGAPERKLNVVQCAFTRFFTHTALFIAANSPNQLEVLSTIIQPRIAEDDVCQFFWDHLGKDLEVLQTAIGCTPDDTCLLLHHMCTVMTQQEGVVGDLVSLATKQERMEWEEEFSMKCLEPTLKDMVNLTRRGNELIVEDASQDQTQLLNMVHEIEDTKTGQASLDQLLINPAVWRYRPHIDVDHFFRQFRLRIEAHRDMDSLYPVIRVFKEKSQVLRALHYVPAILAGQRRLISQLYRRLNRSEAASLFIGEAKDKKECEGLSELLENFTKAWEIVKEHLIAYHCLAPFDEVVYLPAEFHNVIISEESPLAVLLPSTSGPGLCSYILIQFLLSQHNNFMESYCNLLKRSGNDDWYTFNNLPKVSAGNIRERHLVSYTAESLLPLVLANCNYSLTVGKTATLDYDFETFEKQLQDSVLDCKSRVSRHVDGYIEIATVVYKVDATSSRLFKIIRDKIKQECLIPAQRRQIKADFRGSLPAICESIENLNTALSFLKALGGDPFLPLHEFMASALQMKTTILSRKAQEHASLKHVQSLWIFLCFERASILAAHGQNAFDFEVHNLREDLNAEQTTELEEMCKRMSVDRLELLLLQIFECIMLRLSQPRDQYDVTNPANCSLRDELMVNLSDCPFYEKEPAEVKSGMLTAEDLVTHHFPESLCGRHAVRTWLISRELFAQKRK